VDIDVRSFDREPDEFDPAIDHATKTSCLEDKDMHLAPVLPETAPFSPAQREWLNGFLAALVGGAGGETAGNGTRAAPTSFAHPGEISSRGADSPTPDDDAGDYPWHEPSLKIEERLALAAARPLERRLMAAMAQLDCGACGYVCKSYGEALASGAEKSLTLCAPGGKETARKLKELLRSAPASAAMATTLALTPAPASATTHERRRVHTARFLRSELLTAPSCDRGIALVALDLEGTGLRYEVGDALGVHPENCPGEVDRLLAVLGADGNEDLDGESARDALRTKRDLRAVPDALLELLRVRADVDLRARIESTLRGAESDFPGDRDVTETLEALRGALPPALDVLRALEPLRPRLYSISSSIRRHPDEVHLTIGVVRYESRGRERTGVASTFLAERAVLGAPIRVFVHDAPHFRLPSDDSASIIMIGPGTGVAPFRAFLEERALRGASGANWLFSGGRREQSDFLYRDELLEWKRGGVLARLDTAFSRDQERKIYVQERMRERSVELWKWLEEGAHLYVCGDAKRMAPDVDRELREIAQRVGGLTPDAAQSWLQDLATRGRYSRDVY
jgi:sulfite reductase (NADPH) flavoprotein alpha-component